MINYIDPKTKVNSWPSPNKFKLNQHTKDIISKR